MSIELLELAASALGPLKSKLVFVGGATISLWITEAAAPPVRATDDVDVICDTTSWIKYHKLGRELQQHGFFETMNEPVICRWRHRPSNLALDVMPSDENVLGFSNPWYTFAIESAIERTLPSGLEIKAAAPSAIIATKLAAWNGRGKGDLLTSIDFHDIITLINGRPELAMELPQLPLRLKNYIADELAGLESNPYFEYAIQSAMHGYGGLAIDRSAIVLRRLDKIKQTLR